MGLLNGLKHAYNKHGSAWLTVAAITGAAVEGILAYRAGERAGQHPEWGTKEKALNVAGAVGAFGVAAGSALGAQSKNAGTITALVSSNVLKEKNRQKWMKEATNIVGEDNMKKIKESIHRDATKNLQRRADGKMKVIEDVFGAESWMTKEEVYDAVLQFHEIYHVNGSANWGQLLNLLHMPRFDGKKKTIPMTEDGYGNDCVGLSDEQIGYCDYTLWADWECNWIPIDILECENEDGVPYILVSPKIDPYAYYENYD